MNDRRHENGGSGAGQRWTPAMAAMISLLFIALCAGTGASFGTEVSVGPVLQLPGDTTMTIFWETDEALSGEVEYGEPGAAEYTVYTGVSGNPHSVTLTGLRPGTYYNYSIVDGTEAIYRSHFRTLTKERPYRAIIIGDTHIPKDGFSTMVPIIEGLDPDFIVFLGDTVGHGEDLDHWLAFLRAGSVLFDHVPVFTVVGDHERDDGTATRLHHHFFCRPNCKTEGPDNYDVRICGDRFIFLDMEKDTVTSLKWLLRTLLDAKNDPDTDRIFMMSHQGITSFKGRRTGCYELRQIQPVMAACGVTALFSGNDHHYVRGRTYLGLPFFITGGGGGSPYAINEKNIFARFVGRMEASYVGNHFLVLDASRDRCTVRAVDERGQTFDEVTIDTGRKREP